MKVGIQRNRVGGDEAPEAMRGCADFLIIGAARSGTTALASFLDQHPDIFLCSPKEPHFFAFAGEQVAFRGPEDDAAINRVVVTEWEAYHRLYGKASADKVRGEGSVSTLYYHESSIPNIQRYAPDARMIVVLRNPIERAYSNFLYMTAREHEPLTDFAAALDDEPRRIAEGWHHMWHYTRMGFYSRQLRPFFEAFGRERVKVVLFDDLRDAPERVMPELFEYLGVDASFQPNTTQEINRGGVPKRGLLQRSYQFVVERPALKETLKSLLPTNLRLKLRNANLTQPVLPRREFERLREVFTAECGELQQLLGVDLSHWLEGVRND